MLKDEQSIEFLEMIDYKLFRELVTELKLYGINVSQSIEFFKMIVQKYPANLPSHKSV